MGIFEFLFGKKPKIVFTDDGRTKHDHDDKKWAEWKARFEKNSKYDWRSHVGTDAGKNTYKKK